LAAASARPSRSGAGTALPGLGAPERQLARVKPSQALAWRRGIRAAKTQLGLGMPEGRPPPIKPHAALAWPKGIRVAKTLAWLSLSSLE